MSCIVPGTLSPGKLFIEYADKVTGYKHRVSWRFIAGVDLTNIAILRAEAVRIRDLLVPCVISNLQFLAWGIMLPNGSSYYTEAFAAILAGVHTLNMTYAYKSVTIRVEGTAHAPAPGVCYGRTNFAVYHQGAIAYQDGRKTFDTSSDTAWHALVVGINASTYLPADLFGQQADMLSLAAIQFNAHAQKVEGC